MEPIVTRRLQEAVLGIILVAKAIRVVENENDPWALRRYTLLFKLPPFRRDCFLHEMLKLLASVALPLDLRGAYQADGGS